MGSSNGGFKHEKENEEARCLFNHIRVHHNAGQNFDRIFNLALKSFSFRMDGLRPNQCLDEGKGKGFVMPVKKILAVPPDVYKCLQRIGSRAFSIDNVNGTVGSTIQVDHVSTQNEIFTLFTLTRDCNRCTET